MLQYLRHRQLARPSPPRNRGLAALLATGIVCASSIAASAGPVVGTEEGIVKGLIKNGVAEFLGVPYAEPPVGNLRWRPPVKHRPWAGARDATSFKSNCPQINELGVFAGPINLTQESCLYLNVFSPALGPNEKLPVLVFNHGGGNIDGESADYDGSKLAAQGHVVVVTVDYRLGLLGFMAHPAIDAEGHLFGNYGILDQQFALKWVQRNIAQFGGNKDNVTLSGQSAGSKDNVVSLVSPLGTGLFKRVVLESLFQEPTPLPYAQKLGVEFAKAAGCGGGKTADTAKCLRNLSVAQVLQAGLPYGQNFVADGTIAPSFPGGLQGAITAGKFNHVPVLGGTTEDEGTFTLAGTQYNQGTSYATRPPLTAAYYDTFITKTFSGNSGPGGSPPAYPPGTVAKVKAQFPLAAFPSPQQALGAIITAENYACPLHHILGLLSSQVPVYHYEFRDRTAPFYFPKMQGFVPLASHTIDLQFLFPLYHGGPAPPSVIHKLNSKEEDLSDEIVALWTNFALTGNPNGLGQETWPRYQLTPPNKSFLLSEDVPALSTITKAQFTSEHKCDFWDKILTY